MGEVLLFILYPLGYKSGLQTGELPPKGYSLQLFALTLYPTGCNVRICLSELYPKVYISINEMEWTDMIIGQKVKELRKRTGLTQEDLATRSGVGLRFVRELEQGKNTVRLDKVDQVLALFGYHLEPVKDQV